MFILSEVAEEVREASHLRDADRFIAAYLYNIRNETTAEWIYLFTRMGSSPMVLFLSSVLTLALFYKRRFSAWIALFSALIASSISAYAGKVYYKLPRPHDLAWYEEFSYSFPSGHATIAMAFYGILFYFLVLYVKNTKLKLSFAFIGFIFILSMGFSRVYLGVHYLSDVISGFLIGFVWFLFSVTLLGWLDFRNEHRRQN